jgi:hypothetical protein
MEVESYPRAYLYNPNRINSYLLILFHILAIMSTIISSSMSNTNRTTNISNENTNAEDQLNRINLQALQNRDPYITKIIDQAQRVCVYKFIAEKREWVKDEIKAIFIIL